MIRENPPGVNTFPSHNNNVALCGRVNPNVRNSERSVCWNRLGECGHAVRVHNLPTSNRRGSGWPGTRLGSAPVALPRPGRPGLSGCSVQFTPGVDGPPKRTGNVAQSCHAARSSVSWRWRTGSTAQAGEPLIRVRGKSSPCRMLLHIVGGEAGKRVVMRSPCCGRRTSPRYGLLFLIKLSLARARARRPRLDHDHAALTLVMLE